jgi:hypothetical protein
MYNYMTDLSDTSSIKKDEITSLDGVHVVLAYEIDGEPLHKEFQAESCHTSTSADCRVTRPHIWDKVALHD